ncbi:MAG TPA: 3-aminobutyryl-CoA ammonia lyase [Deltaproteobacteria bacterium]|nr:MAG: 3-aminobutyryl-CoA ammonia lyase [Deltaproteobacteria bacterium GWA2_45_12]HBF13686.1 3-aminobutyryl-CoA ammonia lyase [Deltaproteobacteria bacterium]
MAASKLTVTLRTRISNKDIHYAEGLASGSKIMELFGDAATEILIRHDGEEGLFRAYEEVEFLAPVYAGDFIEVHATLVGEGNSSRTIDFEAVKIVEASRDPKHPTHATVLKEPILVAQAMGTCVVKKKH